MPLHQIKNITDLQHLFEQTLDNEEMMLRTALNDKPLVYLAGEEFADNYMKRRREAGVFLHSLRFTDDDIDLAHHKNYTVHNKEVRIAPSSISLEYSVVIWDDHVAIIDPKNITGTHIHDDKHAQVMKQWYDYLWEQSL